MNKVHHGSSVPDGAWPHRGLGHMGTQDTQGSGHTELRTHGDRGHTGTQDTVAQER